MHLLATEPGIDRRRIGRDRSRPDAGRHRHAVERRHRDRAARGGAGAAARAKIRAAPSLRLAPVMRLGHNFSVDLYMETVARGAAGRWRGCSAAAPIGPTGSSAWSRPAATHGIPLALLAGRRQARSRAGPALDRAGRRVPAAVALSRRRRRRATPTIFCAMRASADRPRRPTGRSRRRCCAPGCTGRVARLPSLAEIAAGWRGEGGVVPIVFYRALVQSGNTAPVDALVAALAARGLRPLPIFVQQPQGGRGRRAAEPTSSRRTRPR